MHGEYNILVKLCGKNHVKYIVFTMQTYKKLITDSMESVRIHRLKDLIGLLTNVQD